MLLEMLAPRNDDDDDKLVVFTCFYSNAHYGFKVKYRSDVGRERKVEKMKVVA